MTRRKPAKVKPVKPVRMWAPMNYETIWGAFYTRSAAKAEAVRVMTYPGDPQGEGLERVNLMLKKGELSLTPVLVTPLPRKAKGCAVADLREALKQTCAALNIGEQTAVAFLRSLEESGWRLVGPEATEQMVCGTKLPILTVAELELALDEAIAAAPTIAELLEEKKG